MYHYMAIKKYAKGEQTKQCINKRANIDIGNLKFDS